MFTVNQSLWAIFARKVGKSPVNSGNRSFEYVMRINSISTFIHFLKINLISYNQTTFIYKSEI